MHQKIKSGNVLKIQMSFVSSFMLVFFCSLNVLAAEKDVQVRWNVNPQQVGLNESFNINLEVASSSDVDVQDVSPPDIKGAQFLGQSNGKRVNAGIVFGPQGKMEHKTVQTQIYTFQYAAATEGLLVVPATTVVVNGKSYSLSATRVSVVKESLASQARKSRRQLLEEQDMFNADPFDRVDKMEEAFNKLLQRQFGGAGGGGFQAIPNMNAQDAFAIVAEVDKSNVYKGEQITATWYLYTKAGVREIDTLKYPTLKGFWKEDIELATLLSFQPAELNGQQYNKALLASYALFPIESGKAVIDAYRAKVTVLSGFGKGVTTTKNSTEIPILVKPLPPASADAIFSGAVGEFQIKATSEATSVVAHQPFSIKVRVDGRGNAKQFELPNLQLPPNVELYDIKKDSKFFKDGLSYKEFEIFLIPREEGNIAIPAIATTVFNPKSEKYETLTTTPFEFRVMAGSGQQTMSSTRIKKESDKKPQEPLLPVMNWTPMTTSQWVPNIPIFATLFSVTGLGFMILGIFSAGVFSKPETLKESFRKRFVLLKTLAAQQKWRDLGIEATNLVNHVLGRICDEGGADVHIDRMMDKLPPSVRKELGQDLKNVMNRFYVLGFGPDVAVQQAIEKKDYEQDIKTLEKLMLRAIDLSTLSA